MFQGHPRTSTAAYRRTRKFVLKRDHYLCHVCGKPGADQVDHVRNWANGGSDDPANLAAIHDDPCHRTKTAHEGAAAAQASRNRRPRLRPRAPHPGERR